MRGRALQSLDRKDDDLSDIEHLARANDEYSFTRFCIDELKRLPSEVEPQMLCREWTQIQAAQIVKSAYEKEIQIAVKKGYT